jgi:hypothetical protein
MDLSGTEILKSLSMAKWDTAFRTYGNNHSTLIGLIVDWWINVNPKQTWALEAGPSYSDAVLCLNENLVGVLEVEGSRYKVAITKIETFFEDKKTKIGPLSFGILLFYHAPLGVITDSDFPSPYQLEFVEDIKKVSMHHTNKPIILITLEKKYDRTAKGIRANRYYRAEPYEIGLRLYEAGSEVKYHRITKSS